MVQESLAERITALRRARDAEARSTPSSRKAARSRIRTVRRHIWTRETGVRSVVAPRRRAVTRDAWDAAYGADAGWGEHVLPNLLDAAGLPFLRRHQVLHDYPEIAARVVRMQLAADLETLREGYATARTWCRSQRLPPHAVDELLALYATLGAAQHETIARTEVTLSGIRTPAPRPGARQ